MESAGAKVILFPTNLQSDCVSLEGLEDYITPKTKMLGFCNPHNPMGMLYKKEDLDYLLRLSEKYGFYIMNDEIWSDMIYPECEFTSLWCRAQRAHADGLRLLQDIRSRGTAHRLRVHDEPGDVRPRCQGLSGRHDDRRH